MEQNGTAKSMKRLGLLVAACFVGAPLLAAPVMGQIAYRPLTIGSSLTVNKAFGPDDEDCIYVTSRVANQDGTTHMKKSLLCND